MSSIVQYRLAGNRDIAAVQHLLQLCALPADDLGKSPVVLFAAEQDGEILACAGIEPYPPFGLLRSVAVHPDARGRGIGHRITQMAIDYARNQQIRTLFLLTTTAEHYFAGRGFQPIDRQHVPGPIAATEEFRSICPSTAVVMKKDI